jgi:hypothetical protein
MITKISGSALGRSNGHTVILSRNEQASDEYGNTCVQEGLTLW